MEQLSTNFYVLNGILFALLIAFWAWKRSQIPRVEPPSKKGKGQPGLKELFANGQPEPQPEAAPEAPKAKPAMFNWNGHAWDAHEVLGLQRDASEFEVKKAFNDQVAKMDEESRAFMQKAYEAIKAQS